MSTQNPSAAHEAAVLIDIENAFSVPRTKKLDEARWFAKVGSLLNQLPHALEPHGFVPIDYWAVARVGFDERTKKDGRKFTQTIDVERQIEVLDGLSKLDIRMSWCKEKIADAAIISYVEWRLLRRDLPLGVVLVTEDKDFIPLAYKLAWAGHRVMVVGHRFGVDWKMTDHILIYRKLMHLAQAAG